MELISYLTDQIHERLALLRVGVKPGRHDLLSDDKRVTLRNGVCVADRKRMLVVGNPAALRKVKEN